MPFLFSATKTKVQLKLGITRLKLLQQKKTSINNQQRREIATLLEKGKEESARIRVEHIIREDFHIEALEILELYSEMLLARFGILENSTHCDVAISEAVNTIIYAAQISGVKELVDVRDQLVAKFGLDFAKSAMAPNDLVNARIIQKLKVQTPDPKLVVQYLVAIAECFKVNWECPQQVDEDSFGLKLNLPTAPIVEKQQQEPISVLPIVPQENANEMADFEDLNRRFEALKKRS